MRYSQLSDITPTSQDSINTAQSFRSGGGIREIATAHAPRRAGIDDEADDALLDEQPERQVVGRLTLVPSIGSTAAPVSARANAQKRTVRKDTQTSLPDIRSTSHRSAFQDLCLDGEDTRPRARRDDH